MFSFTLLYCCAQDKPDFWISRQEYLEEGLNCLKKVRRMKGGTHSLLIMTPLYHRISVLLYYCCTVLSYCPILQVYCCSTVAL